MLHLLDAYGRSQGATATPGFALKTVKWAISLDGSGRFLEVLELGDTGARRNPGRQFPMCPDLTQPELMAGGKGCRHFLVDSADVVALHWREDTKANWLFERPEFGAAASLLGELPHGLPAPVADLALKHRFFAKLVSDALQNVVDLKPIAQCLSDGETLRTIARRLGQKGAKPTEKVTFEVSGAFPIEADSWHEWWASFREGLAAKKRKPAGGMRSFLSGDLIVPALTHGPIKGLPGKPGPGGGDPLVCFDKPAFGSYLLKQGENAAVSEGEAKSYREALNSLLRERATTLVGAKVVHWFKDKVPEADDPLPWISEEAEEGALIAQRRAKELLEAIRTGNRPDLAGNRYYALTLSGAAGRVMVRDWMEGRFESLVDSVDAWFDALAITNFSGTKLAKTPGIERVITSLLPPMKPGQKYKDWIKPVGGERVALWKAALQRQAPIPLAVIPRLVGLNLVFTQSGELEAALGGEANFPQTVSLLHARMALLKAYLVRKGDTDMKCELNEDHASPAYHCGRLMAVLAALQKSALGDVGAGVVQRYFAAASATPALVLGRHLSKLEPGLTWWYQEKIAGIWARIKDEVPATLNSEQQTLFALGYYQQMAHDWPKKAEKEGDNR
jgi:CRISPR-associated protein Csd1